eukprot:6689479-Alexandrium_andersonii.AAC.1
MFKDRGTDRANRSARRTKGPAPTTTNTGPRRRSRAGTPREPRCRCVAALAEASCEGGCGDPATALAARIARRGPPPSPVHPAPRRGRRSGPRHPDRHPSRHARGHT